MSKYYRLYPGENEVSVELFFKLKEIDSLGKMRISHLKALDEQQLRLSKLAGRKEETLLQTTTLGNEYRSLQQAMFELEKKLKSSTEQKERLESLGGDESKIKSFQSEIEKLETEGLELLDKQEQIQNEINDSKLFLQGLEKTIKEIETEVLEEKTKLSEEISRLELRLDLLTNELPDNFKGVYQRTLNKKLAHGPFTRIENGTCFFCRYKISRQEESEIDMQQQMKTCNQCGRIFLPLGA